MAILIAEMSGDGIKLLNIERWWAQQFLSSLCRDGAPDLGVSNVGNHAAQEHRLHHARQSLGNKGNRLSAAEADRVVATTGRHVRREHPLALGPPREARPVGHTDGNFVAAAPTPSPPQHKRRNRSRAQWSAAATSAGREEMEMEMRRHRHEIALGTTASSAASVLQYLWGGGWGARSLSAPNTPMPLVLGKRSKNCGLQLHRR